MNKDDSDKTGIKARPGRLFRAARLTLLLGLAGLVLLLLAGPAALEQVLTRQLRQAGLEDPGLKVLAVNHKGLHLGRVSFTQPRLDIDHVSVSYSLGSLVRGRVDEIFISGFNLHLGLTGNGLDPGFPEQGPSSGSGLVLPFSRAQINSSFLTLTFQGRKLAIPFSARADVQEKELKFRADPKLPGVPVIIFGQSNLENLATEVGVRAFSSTTAPLSGNISDETSIPVSSLLEAGLSLDWELDSQGKGRGRVEIKARSSGFKAGLADTRLELDQGYFSVGAYLDEALFFEELQAELNLSRLSFNEFFLEDVSLSLNDVGAALVLSMEAARPVQGVFRLQVAQPTVNDFFFKGHDYQAEFGWSAWAESPWEALRGFMPMELLAEKPLTLQGKGSGRAHVTGQDWFVEVGVHESELGPIDVAAPDFFLGLDQFFLAWSGNLLAGPDEVKIRTDPKTRLKIQNILYESPQTRLSLQGLEFRPDFELNLAGNGDLKISGSGKSTGRFEARLNEARITGEAFKAEADLQFASQQNMKGLVRLMTDLSLVDIPESSLRIRDISLDIPAGFGLDTPGPGSFSTGSLIWQDLTWSGLKGQAAVQDNLVRINGSWPFLKNAELDFTSELDIDSGQAVSGRLAARTGWFELPEKDFLVRISPAFESFDVQGSMMAGLDLTLKGAALDPDLKVEFRDLNLIYPDMDLELTGIKGRIGLDSFSPLTSPGNQRIDVAKLKIGKIELVNGFATFRLDSADRLFLERTRWNFPEGGFVAAHASRFDLGDMSADFEFFFEDIDLLQLVSRLSQEKIVGSGLVYGRVPVIFEGGRVILEDGYLYSVPGTGRLGIRDEEWLEVLLLYVREAMRGHPYLSTVSQRLEQALRDFEYNFLAVNLTRGMLDTSARIELRGRGVEGDPPQEVGGLVINVNDLGEIINRVLHFQISKEESIERALEGLFDF
ncbi:intermembrane phospholipid transport protein YdbH family protein [Desulfonatronovibrio hydrogenovorans]|uniref:intermembrane phospholipid transport protein YdbH family protein n=1 Tax=Desulfonatronovibrio hydrogenovorans TaxID=53245 RepID=UPI0004918C47|nr:YdbH domain-containing protein [Desulfonatronovibrio hydrogenovorans]